jgi:hypothetical protein
MAAWVATMDARWRMAKALAASGLIPQRNANAAFAMMLKAHELGVPAMQGFASIHYFDGKLVLEAALMDGIASKRLGVRKKILEWSSTVCRILFTREGFDPVEAEFTIQEARDAGLLAKKGEVWKRYPKDMLAARCKARGLRMIAPDFFAGTYATEEFEDPEKLERQPTSDAEDLTAELEEKAAMNGDSGETKKEEEEETPKGAPPKVEHKAKALKGKGEEIAGYQCSCGHKEMGESAAEKIEEHVAKEMVPAG